ncbi:AbrB/MazE/SpoVT family DNA-binding domain-containing protein [Candidatus Gottesmanbacteria bacterium]|nr:AbrB/MazE/SpoVT family DNA-binding domain-containing protein [Candidatus Gottesmanbacteria bacterium]MBI5452296.1 AbrB/MazE/SpoVT family DNA-binding domain-containing protein [Candidatus Gottesmanbacteria bacterium]
MIYSATITSQGQITIPAEIRRKFELDKVKKAQISSDDDKIIIKPEKDIMDLYGVFKTKKRIPFRKARKAFEEAMARGEV